MTELIVVLALAIGVPAALLAWCWRWLNRHGQPLPPEQAEEVRRIATEALKRRVNR